LSEKLKIDLNKPICKYHSYDVFPAKAFFDVRSTENFQLMRPKPSASTDQLENLYLAIYDVFFAKLDNKNAVRYVEIRNELAVLNAKKHSIVSVIEFTWKTPENLWMHPVFVDFRKQQIDAINSFLDSPFDLESDTLQEIERVMNVEIGIINDEISILTTELTQLQQESEEVVFNYYADIVALEESHGRTLDEKMMLPKYVELVKLAHKKAEDAKLRQLKNGK